MKIYFPNDLVKQEMLEELVNCCIDENWSVDAVYTTIEKITGENIEEVLKWHR